MFGIKKKKKHYFVLLWKFKSVLGILPVLSKNLTQNINRTINDPIRHQRPRTGGRGDRPRGGGCIGVRYMTNFFFSIPKVLSIELRVYSLLGSSGYGWERWLEVPAKNSDQNVWVSQLPHTKQRQAEASRYIPGLESAILSSVMAQKIHF